MARSYLAFGDIEGRLDVLRVVARLVVFPRFFNVFSIRVIITRLLIFFALFP